MRYERTIAAALRTVELFPSRYKLRSGNENLSRRPFFVFGSGRNGSTLIGTILNRAPEVFVTPEQYALPFAAIRFRLLNILGWDYLVRMVLAEYSRPVNAKTPVTFLHLEQELLDLPKSDRSLLTIVDHVNNNLAESTGKDISLWGDKTPANTRGYQYLKALIPGSKVVFMLRDGRDVVSSFARANKQNFGIQSDPVVAANNWINSIRVWEDLKTSIPERDLLMIRYENLVEDPATTIQSLCAHIGASYNPTMLEPGQSDLMDVAGLKDHRNIEKPVTAASVGSWRDRLTDVEKELVLPILEQDLGRMGYLQRQASRST